MTMPNPFYNKLTSHDIFANITKSVFAGYFSIPFAPNASLNYLMLLPCRTFKYVCTSLPNHGKGAQGSSTKAEELGGLSPGK